MFLESDVILKFLTVYCVFPDIDYDNAFTCPSPNSKYAHLHETQLSITFSLTGS